MFLVVDIHCLEVLVVDRNKALVALAGLAERGEDLHHHIRLLHFFRVLNVRTQRVTRLALEEDWRILTCLYIIKELTEDAP